MLPMDNSSLNWVGRVLLLCLALRSFIRVRIGLLRVLLVASCVCGCDGCVKYGYGGLGGLGGFGVGDVVVWVWIWRCMRDVAFGISDLLPSHCIVIENLIWLSLQYVMEFAYSIRLAL
jgi:hypothetical protein